MTLIEEFENQSEEPTLEQSLLALKPDTLDIVIVKGFKQAHFPKIELHRNELHKPFLFPNDPDIIAIISDMSEAEPEVPVIPPSIQHFKLDQLEDIVNFTIRFIENFAQPSTKSKPPMSKLS
jgi:molybdopterin molybdotransferase